MKSTESQESFLEFGQTMLPANKQRWNKMVILTLEEATLLSYGLEPASSDGTPFENYFDNFHENEDIHSIYDLTLNAVQAGTLPRHDWHYIKAENFVKWANDFDIPIKKEFFYKGPHSQVEKEEQTARKPTTTTTRKEIFCLTAQLFWQNEAKSQENSRVKEYTKPSELARNKDFIELVKIINKIGNIETVKGEVVRETGVDPEWFSKLYPGDNKPGPKTKRKAKPF